ncbi:MAG: right-handed parallel beta-helix repeat-containing protein, partial [Candidatus Thorarchaeota archaeon]
TNAVIHNNTITNNDGDAIKAEVSYRIIITSNTIYGNHFGINIEDTMSGATVTIADNDNSDGCNWP